MFFDLNVIISVTQDHIQKYKILQQFFDYPHLSSYDTTLCHFSNGGTKHLLIRHHLHSAARTNKTTKNSGLPNVSSAGTRTPTKITMV